MLQKMPYLSQPGNREDFFARIELLYPKPDPRYYFVERAYKGAKDAFHGKMREDGTRYFEHLRAVALIMIIHLRVIDHELIAAALLHDIVEDSEHWSIARVTAEFGERVAVLVAYLTKPDVKEFKNKEARDHVYHRRFMAAPREFFFIKLSDRLHNLFTLTSCPHEKQLRKIIETRRYYMPYAEREKILIHEIEEAIEHIELAWQLSPSESSDLLGKMSCMVDA